MRFLPVFLAGATIVTVYAGCGTAGGADEPSSDVGPMPPDVGTLQDAGGGTDAGGLSDAGPTLRDAGSADAGPGSTDVGPGSTDAGRVVDAGSCPLDLVGFATLSGQGQNGTTAGSAGATVNVTTLAELKRYATDSAPYTIRVAGAIVFQPFDEVRVHSDKTIIGVGTKG